jgi:hypothetical protein
MYLKQIPVYTPKQFPDIVIDNLQYLNQVISLGGPGSDMLYSVLLKSKSNFSEGDFICRLDARNVFERNICEKIPFIGSIFNIAKEIDDWEIYDETIDEIIEFIQNS